MTVSILTTILAEAGKAILRRIALHISARVARAVAGYTVRAAMAPYMMPVVGLAIGVAATTAGTTYLAHVYNRPRLRNALAIGGSVLVGATGMVAVVFMGVYLVASNEAAPVDAVVTTVVAWAQTASASGHFDQAALIG